MWGKPLFSVADNCVVEVRNLSAVRDWYKEKLGFREAAKGRKEDSWRAFTDLHISNDDTFADEARSKAGTR